MGLFDRPLAAIKQGYTVPITLQAASEQQAAEAAKALSTIASFFNIKELAAVQKALGNPIVLNLIKARL